jgi:hypothetical protein
MKLASTPIYQPKVRNRFSFFRLAVKLIKYYLLSLFGFVVACLVAQIFDFYTVLVPIMPALGEWFLRLAALAICLLFVAIVIESLRQ